MTLALLSRGYLYPIRGGGPLVFGPGHILVTSEALQPAIDGSADLRDPAPEIVGAGIAEPIITGAVEPAAPEVEEAPDIVGGEDLTPGITK